MSQVQAFLDPHKQQLKSGHGLLTHDVPEETNKCAAEQTKKHYRKRT